VEEHSKAIEHFINNANMPAHDILWAFDVWLKANPAAAKGFALVLKVIYDEEWATEEEMLDYYNNEVGYGEPGFDEAKQAGHQFLKWLAEADSDDDDDEDDDDDDDEDSD